MPKYNPVSIRDMYIAQNRVTISGRMVVYRSGKDYIPDLLSS